MQSLSTVHILAKNLESFKSSRSRVALILEEAFANVGFSVTKMVDYCKAKGLLTAKAPRGKKTREVDNDDGNTFLEAFPLENLERVPVDAV